MSHRNSKQERNARMYKTLAQIAGIATCLFFLLFIIGEGVPDIVNGRGQGLVSFLPFILVPIAGFILTWFKEWPGVIVLIAGAAGLMIYLFTKGNENAAFVYGLPFLLTAILFLLHLKKKSGLQNHHHSTHK